MKDKLLKALVILLGAYFMFSVGGYTNEHVYAKKRPVYEYSARPGDWYSNPAQNKKDLDAMGEDGWRLVAVDPTNTDNRTSTVYLFMREK